MLNFKTTQQLDYQWRPLSRVRKDTISPVLLSWMREKGSLTTRLERAGALTVEVLSDNWSHPTQRERRRLKLRPREATRVREVILKVDGVAVIYARSIVPARALVGHWRYLSHLGSQPLGGYLFLQRGLKRSPIEAACLPANIFKDFNTPIWARRSVFQFYNRGVLVNEAFLPAISELSVKD